MTDSHYVYVLRNPCDGVVFYVGKGVRNRAWAHLRKRVNTAHNPFLYATINKIRSENLEPIVEIVSRFNTHEEALTEESALIARYGRRRDGGCLANLTLGGEGTCGYKFTDQQRQSELTRSKRSISLTGIVRSSDTKKLMSLAKMGNLNPMAGKQSVMKGKTHSTESKAKIKQKRAQQVCSDSTRQKMSETHRAIWAARRNKNLQM